MIRMMLPVSVRAQDRLRSRLARDWREISSIMVIDMEDFGVVSDLWELPLRYASPEDILEVARELEPDLIVDPAAALLPPPGVSELEALLISGPFNTVEDALHAFLSGAMLAPLRRIGLYFGSPLN